MSLFLRYENKTQTVRGNPEKNETVKVNIQIF